MKSNQINFIEIKKSLSKKKRGFTLVELMVVLAIIATMTFIAVPNFTSIKTSVNEKVDKQSCEAIKRIVTTFVADETIDASSEVSFTYNASGGILSDSNINDNVKNALSDVKPPRTDNDKLYEISINDNGSNIIVNVGDISTE